MASDKPFSEACENNKGPILKVLRDAFVDCHDVLEIGSGSGQHAVHFGKHLSHLNWQTADLPIQHAGIKMWLSEAKLHNVLPPLAINADEPSWSLPCRYDGVFSANTLHIMSWPQVERTFQHIGRALVRGGVLVIYGPFNYHGQYTSESNARFDLWLKERNPLSAIRDFEAINSLALKQGMSLLADHAMPANNRCLVWQAR